MWDGYRRSSKDKSKKKKNYHVANSRSTTVLPIMNGHTFLVHNGRVYRPVTVEPFMFGTKLGDYAITKQVCVYRRRKNKKKKGRKK